MNRSVGDQVRRARWLGQLGPLRGPVGTQAPPVEVLGGREAREALGFVIVEAGRAIGWRQSGVVCSLDVGISVAPGDRMPERRVVPVGDRRLRDAITSAVGPMALPVQLIDGMAHMVRS